ncbi:3973_t:CDS:1, partial [Funneliformis caledonium]
ISKAMNLILQSIGINYELSEYITIVRNNLHTLKYDCSFDNSTSDTDDNEEAQFENLSNDFQIFEND